ncbi:hypothetical protein JCM11641_006000 [Rhodosporidiobolus odoratus]
MSSLAVLLNPFDTLPCRDSPRICAQPPPTPPSPAAPAPLNWAPPKRPPSRSRPSGRRDDYRAKYPALCLEEESKPVHREERDEGEAFSSPFTAGSPPSSPPVSSPKRRLRLSTLQTSSKKAPPETISSSAKSRKRPSSVASEKTSGSATFSAEVLRRLWHPTGTLTPDATSVYRSCDPCSKRREKCDHFTVCGSCVVHETVCTWHKARPLHERDLIGASGTDSSSVYLLKEASALRQRVHELAPQVGLDPFDLLLPTTLSDIMTHGLPTPPTSPT